MGLCTSTGPMNRGSAFCRILMKPGLPVFSAPGECQSGDGERGSVAGGGTLGTGASYLCRISLALTHATPVF